MTWRRSGRALWVSLMLAVVTGCGAAVSSETTAPERAADTIGDGSTVQSCQALLDSGWTAPEGEPSFMIDPETWVVEVGFDEDNTLTLDVLNDPACLKLPDIGGPLSRIIPEYEQIRIQECSDAVADVIAGKSPKKGPATGSLDALRQHVLEWCPASFADRLPPK